VKLGLNKQDQKQYAIKIANKKKLKRKVISMNSNSFTLLEKEIAIMKKLVLFSLFYIIYKRIVVKDHPHIIKLFEVIDDVQNEKLYLVMEYMKKGAIFSSNYWAEELPSSTKKPPNVLSEAKARKYFSQLLSALNYRKKKPYFYL